MQALLKYRGGKRREIKFFEKYFPEDFDVCIEPFFCGGVVYFYLLIKNMRLILETGLSLKQSI